MESSPRIRAIGQTAGSRIFQLANVTILTLLAIVWAYPMLNILASSLSQGKYVLSGQITFYPKGLNFYVYRVVFANYMIRVSYLNTIVYTVLGIVSNLVLISLTAYPLSKKRLVYRNVFSFFIFFTMLFGGGLIPTFLVVKALGLYNTRLWIIMSGFFGVWYIVMLRTFYQNIPTELEESAKIDGYNDPQIMFKIYIPLSKPIFATLALFTAVGYWNEYFTALIYLNDQMKFPLQVILRNLLIQGEQLFAKQMEVNTGAMLQLDLALKNAAIVITMAPILLLFLYVQKYFIKGVLVGSLKG